MHLDYSSIVGTVVSALTLIVTLLVRAEVANLRAQILRDQAAQLKECEAKFLNRDFFEFVQQKSASSNGD